MIKSNNVKMPLTERQQNIKRLRDKLNAADPNSPKVFTKYKVLTYLFNIICPPYSLYRILKKNSPFSINEKIIQSGVCIIYMFCLFQGFLKGGF